MRSSSLSVRLHLESLTAPIVTLADFLAPLHTLLLIIIGWRRGVLIFAWAPIKVNLYLSYYISFLFILLALAERFSNAAQSLETLGLQMNVIGSATARAS